MAGPMRRIEFFLFGEIVVLFEKVDNLLFGHAFCVFRKRLRGDADGLHFVAARFENCFCAAQHFQRVGHLLLVARGRD